MVLSILSNGIGLAQSVCAAANSSNGNFQGLSTPTLIDEVVQRNPAASEELLQRAYRSPERFATQHIDQLLVATHRKDPDFVPLSWEVGLTLFCLSETHAELFAGRHIGDLARLGNMSFYARCALKVLEGERPDLAGEIRQRQAHIQLFTMKELVPHIDLDKMKGLLSMLGNRTHSESAPDVEEKLEKKKITLESLKVNLSEVTEDVSQQAKILGKLKSLLKEEEQDRESMARLQQRMALTAPYITEQATLTALLRNYRQERTALAPTHQDTVSTFRDAIRGRDILVFGFGEHHVQHPGDVDTHHEIFVRELLPYLIEQQGIEVFGYEHLPVESNAEIQEYIESGRIEETEGSLLSMLLTGITPRKRDELKNLLDTMHRLSQSDYPVSLYGLRDMREFLRTMLSSTLTGAVAGGMMRHGVEKIMQNSQELIRRTLSRGAKIAMYNGSAHNEFYESPEASVDAFIPGLLGRELDRDQYLALHLLIPQYDAAFTAHNLLQLQNAPETGVTLRGVGSSYTVVQAK